MSIGIRDQAASIQQLLTAAGLTVYDTAAPDNAPARYAVVYTGRRYGGTYRLSSRTQMRSTRALVVVVGATKSEAQWVEERVTQALDGQRVQVAGVLCTPARYSSSRAIERDPDDAAVFSGTMEFTFTAVPTN